MTSHDFKWAAVTCRSTSELSSHGRRCSTSRVDHGIGLAPRRDSPKWDAGSSGRSQAAGGPCDHCSQTFPKTTRPFPNVKKTLKVFGVHPVVYTGRISVLRIWYGSVLRFVCPQLWLSIQPFYVEPHYTFSLLRLRMRHDWKNSPHLFIMVLSAFTVDLHAIFESVLFYNPWTHSANSPLTDQIKIKRETSVTNIFTTRHKMSICQKRTDIVGFFQIWYPLLNDDLLYSLACKKQNEKCSLAAIQWVSATIPRPSPNHPPTWTIILRNCGVSHRFVACKGCRFWRRKCYVDTSRQLHPRPYWSRWDDSIATWVFVHSHGHTSFAFLKGL